MVTERSDICAGITLDTEQDKAVFNIEDFQFVYSTDPENTFDCTFSRGALVDFSRELGSNLFDSVLVRIPVQPHQADVFFVMLEEKRGETHCIAEHDKKHSGDLRVKRSGVSYLASEHPADPCRYLVAGWAPRFIYYENPWMVP
jgi:hypothetical protein